MQFTFCRNANFMHKMHSFQKQSYIAVITVILGIKLYSYGEKINVVTKFNITELINMGAITKL